MNQQPTTGQPPALGNIKHIVVLMFENRSFDHLFGSFPNVNGLFDDAGDFKPDCYNLQDPLSQPGPDNPKYFPEPVDPGLPLPHDFTHDFGDGMMPDLFGPIFTVTGEPPSPSNCCAHYFSGYKDGKATGTVPNPPTTYPATNSGFFTTYNSCKQQGQSALNYFEKGAPRILNQLAEEFVLCDNWHCDMPSHTLPNRAFMHCATTGAVGIDDLDNGVVGALSIFDLITNQPALAPDWKMYAPIASDGSLGQLDTRFLNGHQLPYPGVPITQFAADCQSGTLPFYSFIMCWTPHTNKYTDTSMHPAAMIQPGENLLAAVYNTLRNSPHWGDTLLVVNFDENGGLYDHVLPPATTPPDPRRPTVTQTTRGCCGNKWSLDATFDFSLLGLRIPAILISPWLSKGIDSTQLQNTSVLKFVIDRMNARYGTGAAYLTARDATAPSLDTVFWAFGQTAPRTDCPNWIVPYKQVPFNDPTIFLAIPYHEGKLTVWTPPEGTAEEPPVPYINELMNIYVGPLPGHPDSGKQITRDFATDAEVTEYIKEREQAAAVYFESKGDNYTTH